MAKKIITPRMAVKFRMATRERRYHNLFLLGEDWIPLYILSVLFTGLYFFIIQGMITGPPAYKWAFSWGSIFLWALLLYFTINKSRKERLKEIEYGWKGEITEHEIHERKLRLGITRKTPTIIQWLLLNPIVLPVAITIRGIYRIF
jgi:hypothetical protein